MSMEETKPSVESKRVCEIATRLARAYKSRQLYSSGSPVPRTAIERFLETLTPFLNANNLLTLTVNESELLYHGKPVYANPSRRESLAFRLYRDGVRSITFHSGISPDEMMVLFEGLGQTNPQSDDSTDVVTELWERELPHVTYLAVDDCLEPESSEDNLSQVTASQQSMAVLDEVESALGVVTMIELPLSEEERRSIANVSLSEDELDEIGQEVLADEKLDGSEKVSEIFLEILENPVCPEVSSDVARALEALGADLVRTGNLIQATNLLREAKALMDSEPPVPEETRRILRGFVEAGGSEKELMLLEARMEEASARELIVFEQYLSELLSNAITPLCAMLGRIKSRRARETICRALSVLAKDNLEPLLSMLSDSRWYLVRNLVRVLGLMKERRALIYLDGLLSHEDPKVRAEVVYCLGEIGGTDAVVLLSRPLRDSEKSIRMLAAKRLGQLGDSSAAAAISERITAKDFFRKESDEKWEFFDAMTRTGGEESLHVFGRVLGKRFLFHMAEADEMKKCAVAAIARVGTREAASLLEETARRSRGKLRKCCLEALRLCSLKDAGMDETFSRADEQKVVERR